MDRLEILKKAKEKVDALVAEKLRAEQDDSADEKATEMAIEMQKHDALVSAIEANYISPEEMARAFEEAVSKIAVNVPEIKVPLIQIPDIKVPEAKVSFTIPEIKLPTINVPEPKVTVNVPEVKIPPFPEIKMPESMEIHGEVGLFGYGFNNPLPVQLRDAEGNPVSLPDMMSVISGGGGPRYVKINNTVSEPIPISGNITSTPGATYYASDAIGSVNIVQSIPLNVSLSGATGTMGVVTINPDGNPVYGGGTSGGGLTDAELRASSIDVQQASGASWSTNVLSMPSVTVTSVTNSIATSILGGDGQTVDPRNRTWTITETVNVTAPNSMDVQQASGASWSMNVLSIPSVTVTGITNTTAHSIVDSSGVGYSGTNPVPITWVSGAGVSTTVNIGDSSGVGYSGSNPLPITIVSGALVTTGAYLLTGDGVYRDVLPTKEVRSATPSQTSPNVTNSNTSILASNANRLGATIYNEGGATCYVKLGATASVTSYSCQVASGGYYEVPFGYTGAIDGITSASTAQLRVTEIT